jgi:hypothetical protein
MQLQHFTIEIGTNLLLEGRDLLRPEPPFSRPIFTRWAAPSDHANILSERRDRDKCIKIFAHLLSSFFNS